MGKQQKNKRYSSGGEPCPWWLPIPVLDGWLDRKAGLLKVDQLYRPRFKRFLWRLGWTAAHWLTHKPLRTDKKLTMAVCGPSSTTCVCNCAQGGPCDHVWDGKPLRLGNGGSATCSRCGAVAIDHDMWVMP